MHIILSAFSAPTGISHTVRQSYSIFNYASYIMRIQEVGICKEGDGEVVLWPEERKGSNHEQSLNSSVV